jgi:hypothetical protein
MSTPGVPSPNQARTPPRAANPSPVRQSPRIQKSDIPMVGQTFDTPENMRKFVQEYADKEGFLFSDSPVYHDEQKSRKFSKGVLDKMLARGFYYCHKRKNSCSFKIKYTFDSQETKYRFTVKSN